MSTAPEEHNSETRLDDHNGNSCDSDGEEGSDES